MWIFKKEVEYLDIISDKEINPQPNKIEAIKQLGPPRMRKQLQGFLGIINYYYRLYLTSKINTKTLTNLTSPKTKFK